MRFGIRFIELLGDEPNLTFPNPPRLNYNLELSLELSVRRTKITLVLCHFAKNNASIDLKFQPTPVSDDKCFDSDI